MGHESYSSGELDAEGPFARSIDTLKSIGLLVQDKVAEYMIMEDRQVRVLYPPSHPYSVAMDAYQNARLDDDKIIDCAHMLGNSYFDAFFPDQSEALKLWHAIASADFGFLVYDPESRRYKPVEFNKETRKWDRPRQLFGEDLINANLRAYEAEVDLDDLQDLQRDIITGVVTEVAGLERLTAFHVADQQERQ